MSSQAAGAQAARKARDGRSLQRATIIIGVASLALAAAVTYAAASASTGKGSQVPAGGSNGSVTVTVTPTPSSGESDDGHDGTRSPAPNAQKPQPGGAPVAVTGGS